MTSAILEPIAAKNAGDAREWAFCRACGVERTAHDSLAYDKASDCEANGHGYSLKASAFTLMSGALCEGLQTLDEIWALYAERVHSDRFVYVTCDWVAYIMDINEFGEFVKTFAHCERESSKNGGAVKVRCRKESSKMVAWLMERVA